MKKWNRAGQWCWIFLATCGLQANAALEGSVKAIEDAAQLITDNQYALARVYLDPALIDYRITSGQRSRAYYLRGYTHFVQSAFVSAAKDYVRALEFNPGNVSAQAALAYLHHKGLGVTENPWEAFRLYLKAARNGHADSILYVGRAFLEGLGVEANIKKSRYWLTKAINTGQTLAMVDLGRSYLKEYAETPEPHTATTWLQKAADAGITTSYVFLGMAYLKGEGVEEDHNKALAYFQKCAANEEVSCMSGLAYLYWQGNHHTQNQEEAEHWYRQAALTGELDAQFRLSEYLHYTAPGTDAYLPWLLKAVQGNHSLALNTYAWELATSARADKRNGGRAVLFANRLVRKRRSAASLATLAAAYAELGQFRKAVTLQEEAIAEVVDQETTVAEWQTRLTGYRNGVPWRD